MTRDGAANPAALWVLIGYWGYLTGIQGSVAPFLARSFGQGDADLARLMAWVGLASLGSLALSRHADRVGRRRLLLGCFGLLPAAALVAALAPGTATYLGAQLAIYALGGTLLATVTVVLAEEPPEGERGRGHGRAGLVLAASTVLPLAATAALAHRPDVWRFVWGLAVLPVALVPWAFRAVPESRRWRAAAARGETARAGIRATLRPEYRQRTIPCLLALVLVGGVEAVTRTWLLYRPVRELGLDPRLATAVLALGGAVGLIGFHFGGRLADSWGRRRTFGAAAVLFATGTIGYYGSTPPAGSLPAFLWLVAFLSLLSAGGGAALVSFRAQATELLPTRLRATAGGLMAVANALGWGLAMGAIAWMAGPLGGLGNAVATLVAVALPAAALLLRRLPETAGLSLEQAASPSPARL